jgi:hypothetical protein
MSPAADIECADWALAGPTLGLTRLAISVSLASVSFSYFSVLARSSSVIVLRSSLAQFSNATIGGNFIVLCPLRVGKQGGVHNSCLDLFTHEFVTFLDDPG